MAELSPAAQAVLDAAAKAMECPDGFLPYELELMAAALRAAADQLGESRAPGAEFEDLYPRIIEVDDLLAIVAELESQ